LHAIENLPDSNPFKGEFVHQCQEKSVRWAFLILGGDFLM